jgi:membrane protein implicated in regulation of membrane protease activity
MGLSRNQNACTLYASLYPSPGAPIMANHIIWLILGLGLVIVEMVTGTFYLLVLGIAAFAGSVAAFLGASLLLQVLSTGAIAVIGIFAVHRWHRSRGRKGAGVPNVLDVGQTVTLESWIDESARLVRVSYRGSSWDAQLLGDAAVQPRDLLYICGMDGSRLQVSRVKPG